MKTISAIKAKTFTEKLIGLMFKKTFEGYFLLDRCKSIHTCWMLFSIDVLAIDSNNTVIDIKKNVQPWRLYCAPRQTRAILETKTLEEKQLDVRVGDTIDLIIN